MGLPKPKGKQLEVLDLKPEGHNVVLILRSKLVERLIQASQNGKVDLRSFLYMLSDTTYIRRSSNIKRVLAYLSAFSGSGLIEDFIKKIDV